MVIHDIVIDDSYCNIICNSPDCCGNVPPCAFINCIFVYHFERVVFRHCKFYNCTFRNGSFNYVYFYDCEFKKIIFEDDPRKCIVNSEMVVSNIIDEKFRQNFIETAPFPKTGSFIGWKKAAILLNNKDLDHIINPMKLLYAGKPVDRVFAPCIIELLIPEDAKRSCAFSNKCRCDKAKVLGIQSINGQSFPTNTIAYSKYDLAFAYRVGEIVTPREPFDDDPFNECGSGIHFFMSREEAVGY